MAKGTILNPITQGEWNVREVVRVDEAKQRLLLKITGNLAPIRISNTSPGSTSMAAGSSASPLPMATTGSNSRPTANGC